MPRLYHKDLPEGQNIIEVADDNENKIELLAKSGWSTEVPKKYQEAASSDAPATRSSKEG